VQQRGIDPARIVLYGQSVGSGPSCQYAARSGVGGASCSGGEDGCGVRGGGGGSGGSGGDSCSSMSGGAGGGGSSGVHNIGGVVLVSPIMSGLRVGPSSHPLFSSTRAAY